MKKIIKLTESELVNLVKRVISEEKKMLSESATINGVKVDVSGGGLSTIAKGVANKYLVSVKCGKSTFGVFVPVYAGQISLSSLWDNKGGGIGGKDNTGKVFSIPATKAATLVSQMVSGVSSIKTEGEGTIAGITGSCYVTLKKR